MIDLSFLTEEEHEAIMKVLNRDAALKRAEEERVRHLPEKIKDDQQLKTMSGQWFYEAKARRHRDRIHGADIIRASMRKKRLPAEADQSHLRASRIKESLAEDVSKEARLSPEPASVGEQREDKAPASSRSSLLNPTSTVTGQSEKNTKCSALSPNKQRKNPFNGSELPEDHLLQQTNSKQSKNGRTDFSQTSGEGELSESNGKLWAPDMPTQKSEQSKKTFPDPENGPQIKTPIPKARKMLKKSNDFKQDGSQPLPGQRTESVNAKGAPRGILKRNSSSSSTDSETLRYHHHFDPQSKTLSPGLTIHERISEKHSLEDENSPNLQEPLKHVRFSAVSEELPQSPESEHSPDVGVLSALKSDMLKTGSRDAGDRPEFVGDPQPSPSRKPDSSPTESENETFQPLTSNSLPLSGCHSLSEVSTASPQPTENSPIINEHRANSQETLRRESDLPQRPADELSHTEPESTQVPDHSSRDHQQGKSLHLKTLNAQTSPRPRSYATEITKTAEESISKVLDWFNRSSHIHSQSSLLHPQGLEPKVQDSESQLAISLLADDTSLRENDLEILPPTQAKGTPVGSESPSHLETNIPSSGNNQNKNGDFRSKPILSSQHSLGNPGTSQPFQLYSPGQRSTNMDHCTGSDIRQGGELLIPTSNNILEGPGLKNQTPLSIEDIGSSREEEFRPCVYRKSEECSDLNDDSLPVITDPKKAETKSRVSLKAQKFGSPLGTPKNRTHWEKPEIPLQRELGEISNNHVHREKYQRVSDRISFWESGKVTTKQEQREPLSPHSQGPCMGSKQFPVDSLYTVQRVHNQVTARQVILDEDGQEIHPLGFHSTNKSQQTRPKILIPLRNFPPAEQSGKMPPFQKNKKSEELPTERLPMADTSGSGRDVTSPTLPCPSGAGIKAQAFLEKNRYMTGELNPNFKVMSLKERMDEPNTEQICDHSQFENLRKFWDLGAHMNSKENVEKNSPTIGQKHPGSLNSQAHREFRDIKSSGENVHGLEIALSQKNIPASEKLNSQITPQGAPEEPMLPLRSTGKGTQLPGNEPLKDNVDTTVERSAIAVLKEDTNHTLPEIQESRMKTTVSSKDYKDTSRNTVQKLLSEASSPPVTQPSGGKVDEYKVFGPGASENRTSFVDTEQERKEPREVIYEHVEKTVAPPKASTNSLTASLDRLRKEAGELQASPMQTNTQPMECPHPVVLPSLLYRKDSLGEVTNSAQGVSSLEDAHLAAWEEEILASQMEISETIEKITLPPKSVSDHMSAVLKKLLRETQLSNPGKVEVLPGEDNEFPEGMQMIDNPPDPLGATSLQTRLDIIAPDKNYCHPFSTAPVKTHEVGSNIDAQKTPSEQTKNSPNYTVVAQSVGALPQNVVDIMREISFQPRSELLEYMDEALNPLPISDGLLEETIETSSSKHEQDRGALSSSELMDRVEVTRPAASPAHPEEIKEIVEKVKAPPTTHSAFDVGFEKLLKEVSEDPYPPLGSVKEEFPEKEPSQMKQARSLGTESCLGNEPVSEASERKLASNIDHPASQYDAGLGNKAVTDISADLCCPEREVEVSRAPHLYVSHGSGTIKTMGFPEDRKSKIADTLQGASLSSPGKVSETVSVSREEQPRSLLMSQGGPEKASEVELMLASPCAQQVQEDTEFPDSSVSDGNIHSQTSSSEEEKSSPDLRTLERNAARKMPFKSLEDISSDSSNPAKVDNLPGELVHSAEDVSTVSAPSDDHFSHLDKLKRMSKSVPAFLQDESDDRETDSASESSYQLRRHKKSPSSLTNLSSSSGMTSLSSVSGSVMSVYSGDFGNLEVKGSIQFAIDYVDSLKELHVFVAQCKDLAAADTKKQRSDPYVKSYLLPDKGKTGKKKTLVVKKTLNPVYNEILRYKVEKQTLKTQKLNLSVWHRDTFKRNSFLGEVELDFDSWDWDNKENKQLMWYPLKHKIPSVALEAENRGEMKLALQYVPEPVPGKRSPTTGEVHIWVKECLGLPALRSSQLNSFVKCTILPDTSRKSRQKTRAVGKTTHPVFNHTMVYDGFRPEDLTEACVELTVWDHYKLTNQFLGGLRIGFGRGQSYGTEVDWMDSTPEEAAIWEKMVSAPNTWVEATLPLRMLLIAKIAK